ncbi:calcineurin-like phosphoesterase C-terminal domain-containing protein, partial [Pedobacter sp.]|uniref:calcineurin-like phosphoesterase C-terminal domain-containing protein n=1 Tax=Pedobacter sp. TaxID=1411316 RepID=UPI003D7F4A24
VSVNVWNWDKDWKVEWFEDEKPMGLMQQFIGLDPDAIKYLQEVAKTSPYPWIKPRLTEHLFFANPSVGSKEIKIVVTDRFGEQYTDRIKIFN